MKQEQMIVGRIHTEGISIRHFAGWMWKHIIDFIFVTDNIDDTMLEDNICKGIDGLIIKWITYFWVALCEPGLRK